MNNLFTYQEPEESTGLLLWKVTSLWQSQIKMKLKKYDLNHTQFVVLASTVWHSHLKKGVTQQQIAQQVNLDKMVTSNTLRSLEKKGLLKRKEHISDTRAKTIHITKKGITLFEKAVKDVETFDISFFGSLKKKNDFNNELLRLSSQQPIT